jgi:superfamily II DNA or RNA helicase
MEIPVGRRVVARGETWKVEACSVFTDCQAVTLSGLSSANSGTRRTLLTPFDRLAPIHRDVPSAHIRPRAWAWRVLAAVAESVPFGGLQTAAAARIDLLPFQLEPALAILRHAATRVLIADQVGLGKTIQAGVVLRELSARDEGFRAVALVPAGLREQWRRELADRFALDAIHADALWVAERNRDLPPDVNPWSLPGIYLASLDLVKRPEVLRALEDVTWDVALVDEAHNCTLATARLAAARAITARARRVVLMTATPPDGDAAQLNALRDLGRLGDPLIEFRRTREAVMNAPARRSALLQVRLSAGERRMHRLLDRYTTLVWHEATTLADSRARLAVTILRKRALSSAWSLQLSVQRRRALLATGPVEQDRQLTLPFGDEDVVEDDVPDAILGAAGLGDVERELALLEGIEAAARQATQAESKVRFLLRLLRRIREPAIVFTEYRDTLARLEGVLSAAGVTPLVLHGGLPARERVATQQAFNAGGAVLLATDAASEGLNLQQRCRLVVHFELPWTPARLEQRAGRVDRLGQSRRVHEVMLVARHTAERLVLGPLLRRARQARGHAGGGAVLNALTESHVATALMEGRALDVESSSTPTASPSLDLRLEAENEARRIARARVAHIVREPRERMWITARRPPTAVTLVFTVSLEDRFGQRVHATAVVLTATVEESLDSRRSARALRAGAGEFHDLVRSVAARDIATARRRHKEMMEALAGRRSAMQRTLPSAAQSLVQIGLFDRRGVHALERRHEAATLLAEQAEDWRAAAAATSDLVERIALIAVRFGR